MNQCRDGNILTFSVVQKVNPTPFGLPLQVFKLAVFEVWNLISPFKGLLFGIEQRSSEVADCTDAYRPLRSELVMHCLTIKAVHNHLLNRCILEKMHNIPLLHFPWQHSNVRARNQGNLKDFRDTWSSGRPLLTPSRGGSSSSAANLISANCSQVQSTGGIPRGRRKTCCRVTLLLHFLPRCIMEVEMSIG